MSKTTHIERTAAEPRQSGLHAVKLCRIQRVSPSIRLLTLALPCAIKFLPGQWLDLHIPTLPSPGGFTITSPPSSALLHASPNASPTLPYKPALLARFPPLPAPVPDAAAPRPYLELAVQRTSNAPALWLWQPESRILNAELQVRVGGSFTWPPRGGDGGVDGGSRIRKAVLVAGGVGINPFVSMLGAMCEGPGGSGSGSGSGLEEVEVLYSSKLSGANLREVLFVEKLAEMVGRGAKGGGGGGGGGGGRRELRVKVRLFLTAVDERAEGRVEEWMREVGTDGFEIRARRISDGDLEDALGPVEERREAGTVAYVCGPGPMVDEVVGKLKGAEGMGAERVFYEKWW